MKKGFILFFSFALVLSSCKSRKFDSFKDDVYYDPKEAKHLAMLAAEARAKAEAEQKAKLEAERLAQKAKDDANPYYKDPSYNSDDYYDYAYASRLKRFHNPVYGTGYYDNWYTNSYWYNQNPMCYGSSIYSTYDWWMPSVQFGMYYGNTWGGYGMSYWNSPYNFCGPYGYNSYWNNPYYGFNSPYYYGGGFGYPYYGYNSPWYNNGGWGYYNSYDHNSNYTYAPRTGNIGGNSSRGTYAGMAVPENGENERVRFFNQINEQQETQVKFTPIERKVNQANQNNFDNPVKNQNDTYIRNNNGGGNSEGQNSNQNTWIKNPNRSNNSSNENNNQQEQNNNPRKNFGNKVLGEKDNSNLNQDFNNNRSFNPGSNNNNSGGTTKRPR